MITLQSDNIDIMETDVMCYHNLHIKLKYRMHTTCTLSPFPISASSIRLHVYINHELEALRCLDPFFSVMRMHCCFISLPLLWYHDYTNGNPYSAHTDCSLEFLSDITPHPIVLACKFCSTVVDILQNLK